MSRREGDSPLGRVTCREVVAPPAQGRRRRDGFRELRCSDQSCFRWGKPDGGRANVTNPRLPAAHSDDRRSDSCIARKKLSTSFSRRNSRCCITLRSLSHRSRVFILCTRCITPPRALLAPSHHSHFPPASASPSRRAPRPPGPEYVPPRHPSATRFYHTYTIM